MPNIWDDDYSSECFIESFYNSLITEHEKAKHLNLLYQSIKYFNDDEAEVFETKDSSSQKHLTQILTYLGKRMFCQFDLKDFYKYNFDNDSKFVFKDLSEMDRRDIKKGKEVYYIDDHYAYYSHIVKVWKEGDELFAKCEFEGVETEDYSVYKDTETLYQIDLRL
jgi:hypothetical protein